MAEAASNPLCSMKPFSEATTVSLQPMCMAAHLHSIPVLDHATGFVFLFM